LPHFTTKKRGTGLGLAIVNRIIVDHSGTIQVRDNNPRGTVFVIDLGEASPPSKTDNPLEADFRRTSSPF
ncbi:MAG: hypothetical protein COV67_03280, partial [Nitrospinae bacterium CG11_big_fil_rev_8_21_14_0_20_56_8]